MVYYKLSLVWGFPLFIVFVRIAYGPLQTLASVGLSIFVHVAYGPLQTLASVGLSVFIVFVCVAYQDSQ